MQPNLLFYRGAALPIKKEKAGITTIATTTIISLLMAQFLGWL